jgi:hypothetical protein
MRIFVICPVREPQWQEEIQLYVEQLEANGHNVHWPPRDTDQSTMNGGMDICARNADAINDADEVHIFYNGKSQGSHFDMGVAFALKKVVRVIKSIDVPPDSVKSFQQMLQAWAKVQ